MECGIASDLLSRSPMPHTPFTSTSPSGTLGACVLPQGRSKVSSSLSSTANAAPTQDKNLIPSVIHHQAEQIANARHLLNQLTTTEVGGGSCMHWRCFCYAHSTEATDCVSGFCPFEHPFLQRSGCASLFAGKQHLRGI